MPQNPADGAPLVIRERSTEGKIRYASQKLTEVHDQLVDTASRDHRGTIIGLALQLDWAADAVKALEIENERLRNGAAYALGVAEVIEANGIKWAADSVRRAVNGELA